MKSPLKNSNESHSQVAVTRGGARLGSANGVQAQPLTQGAESSAEIDSAPRVALQRKQLHAAFGHAIQRQAGPEEEELLQGKLNTVQRQGPEEEELLQGKFDPVQRQGPEEELLQGKFAPVQRQELEEQEPLQVKFAAAEAPAQSQRANKLLVIPVSQQNGTVTQRERTNIPRPAYGIDESFVSWESGGGYESVKWINRTNEVDETLTPSTAGLDKVKKGLLKSVEIAKVQMDPTANSVMLYPRNPDHGLWRILNVGGAPSWELVSELETEERRRLLLKTTVVTNVKTTGYLDGIAGLVNPTAKQIADRVFTNMRGSALAYATAGGTPDGVANGATTGQCHAVNGGLGIVIQAALASRGVDAAVEKVDENNPFMTGPDGYGNNVIRGGSTNIVKQKTGEGEPTDYTDSAIKFDNHSWITVGGQVYDLIAGIADGANSCVYRRLTPSGENEYDVQGEAAGTKLVKIDAAVGAPWTQAYQLQRPA
jgi:hypothetical protein